ncbi:UDP-2,4-diacetamido-2,4,6-trideoxy-beta-L-altropyranose hydrolase [Bradyrhizobium sp.]|uniref:UDP-2,4-diacetamido-2,4, 6-trideoxy-beta-L-altropyranose hydrolase n=1 Tax=Bradyrhizobium sp. TaxID=376 RepID=UPI003C73EBF0
MLIVFRADADPAIGGGHVMRCLTLAAEMQQRGADVVFLCKEETTDTVPALARSGITCLAADQHDWNDAIAAGKYCGKRVNLIVVDTYRLGYEFERSLRRHSCPVLVIDDAPNRRHHCDLLLDMTLDRAAADYANVIPAHCRVLAGSSYALLRGEFGELRSQSLARRKASSTPKSVFISLGLTDIGGQTAAIARMLASDSWLERIVVVTGPTTPTFRDIKGLEGEAPRIRVCVDPPDIAELMADADLAIGTPGTSCWERCCLGLPSIMLVVAQNQVDNAHALEQAGAARVLPLSSDSASSISRIVRELAETPNQLAQMSRNAAKICDGDGAFRVGCAIDELVLPDSTGQLTLRAATADDSRRLWLWRNEHGARNMSPDQRPVAWEAHSRWLTARLADADTMIFIVETNGRPCGSVRFHVEQTKNASVSIAMARHVRGKGYGAAALDSACQAVFKQQFCDRIEARVKRENIASQKIFEKCGFLTVGTDAVYLFYRRMRPVDAKPNGSVARQAR